MQRREFLQNRCAGRVERVGATRACRPSLQPGPTRTAAGADRSGLPGADPVECRRQHPRSPRAGGVRHLEIRAELRPEVPGSPRAGSPGVRRLPRDAGQGKGPGCRPDCHAGFRARGADQCVSRGGVARVLRTDAGSQPAGRPFHDRNHAAHRQAAAGWISAAEQSSLPARPRETDRGSPAARTDHGGADTVGSGGGGLARLAQTLHHSRRRAAPF